MRIQKIFASGLGPVGVMEMLRSDKVLPHLSVLVSRALVYVVVTATVLGVIWSCIARVSVVVSADGRLAPQAEPVRLSITDGGIVSAVPVQVGTKVRAGDPILELDSFRETAEVERVRHELEQSRAQAQGYADSARILAGSAEDIMQELDDSKVALRLSQKQSEALQAAYKGGAVSLFIVQAKDAEIAKTRAQIAQFRSDLSRAEADERQDQSSSAAAFDNVKALTIELKRDIQTQKRTVLTAPVDGTVSYINSLRPGRYLAPNDVAAMIVPSAEPLLAEVWIPNESIRRVQPPLHAQMKLAAFPYQQFGLLSGTLISVDPDANDSGSYRAWIKPDRLTLADSHGVENIRTGLALTAEIEIERRSVISVLLDPFQRLRGGLRVSQ